MTTRMTAAQLVNHLNGKAKADKRRVRGAEPVEVDGIKFHSKGEARRWQELKILASTGQITDLKRQVPFTLQGQDGPILTPTGRPMRYIADFTYRNRVGREVVEDFKGFATELFALKRAILAAQGVTIRIVGCAKEGDGTWCENDYRDLRDQMVGEKAE